MLCFPQDIGSGWLERLRAKRKYGEDRGLPNLKKPYNTYVERSARQSWKVADSVDKESRQEMAPHVEETLTNHPPTTNLQFGPSRSLSLRQASGSSMPSGSLGPRPTLVD